MSKYIFAITKDEELGNIVGVSRKDYFDKHQYTQDVYSREDMIELQKILETNNMFELESSQYETNFSFEKTKAILEAEPLFSYSQSFQDFLDSEENDD